MSPSNHPSDSAQSRAFSLLELLVAMAILSMLVVLVASMIGSIQDVWKRTSARSEQFRSARQGLETIQARLSQATLNPYWSVASNATGLRYERQSELRFLCGQTPAILSGVSPLPLTINGTAIFFQAPTGFFSNSAMNLESALNTWGYYVEYGSDSDYRPPFLSSSSVPAKNRFRLIEFLDPSDNLEVFKKTSGAPTYFGKEWFTDPLSKTNNRRVLAENIVALVALPRLSSAEDRSVGQVGLSPLFSYDSISTNGIPITGADGILRNQTNTHQLPPIVDLAVVAISESTASRTNWGSTPPFDMTGLFQDATRMESDLLKLQSNIAASGVSARIFRTSVPISAAKWSTQ